VDEVEAEGSGVSELLESGLTFFFVFFAFEPDGREVRGEDDRLRFDMRFFSGAVCLNERCPLSFSENNGGVK
jgi:hypothetical protein